ncbi:MAG: F0F1 ATP synthase subunit A [Planctomycetaceae bacterium]|nr:F0F1 ATP synthase subunit A [Planctomycetaceae bacterium]
MSSFFHPRVLAVIAVLVGAIWFQNTHIAHHHSDSPFQVLFAHVVPAHLLSDTHDESAKLVSVELPAALSIFDMDKAREGAQLVLTNLQIFQVASLLLILICFSGVPGYLRTGQGDIVSRLFAGFALWLRDDVVYPVMGRETGGKFLPYFLSVFFFILFMNLGGLLPMSATPTTSIFITASLALMTLAVTLVFGMVVQGPIAFWKHLVPHVPLLLWPLMFLVEVVGLFVKPFALTVRLFATMTGGHLVVLSFMGILFFFAMQLGTGVAYATAPVWVGFAVFIMIIEAFVAMLQAYIFTQLSVIFVQAAIHPEH